MTEDPRIVHLARVTERECTARHLSVEATAATIDGQIHEAARQIDSLSRPELQSFRRKVMALRELIDERLRELQLRLDAEGTYEQPARACPVMDDGDAA